ncbi:MAG: radical SAM protein [Acidobacteriaceae bacterium]|nr:radical SAM protein [Acidobacteriaceae bacterium]
MNFEELVCPPEYHIFQRETAFLVSDPVAFLWFVTDETGKTVVDSLAKDRSLHSVCRDVSDLWVRTGVSGSQDAESYVRTFVSHLVKIGFLHRGAYRPPDWGAGVQTRPTILYLHLTSKCNLKCPYCYNQEHRHQLIQIGKQQAPSEKKTPLSTEPETAKLLQVVEEAAGLGFTSLKLTGGEALLNKDALRIAARAKECGMSVNLLTNATLITESVAAEISKVVDSVSISLDSDNAEEHDTVRGAGTHAAVLRSINLLKEKGLKHLHLNAVITPVNLKSVGSFLDYAWNSLKADQVTIAATGLNVEDPNGRWRAGEYMLSGDEYRFVYDQERDFYVKRKNAEANMPVVRTSSLFRRHCGVGNGLLSVDPNGDIYPCQTLHNPEFVTGNAFQDGGLTKLLTESSPVLDRVKGATVDKLPECKTCPVRYVCAGGCRAEAYTNEGDFLARHRALCPTLFQSALDRMWDAASIPASQLDEMRKKRNDVQEIQPVSA